MGAPDPSPFRPASRYALPMIHAIGNEIPDIDKSAFVAHNAEVAGKISIAAGASIWFSATLRGDMEGIEIGENSNVQDSATLHVEHDRKCVVGRNVTIGHNAVVHACTVGDECLIGMGAIVLSGAVIGDGSIIGAGALVTEGKEIPPRSLVVGSPGKVIRQVSDEQIEKIMANAKEYCGLAKKAKTEYREVK